MKKKLYYVVELQLDSSESWNGLKTITVYEMINNEPKRFAEIESDSYYTSEEAIEEYLVDNGYGDEEFDFIQL